MAAQRFGLTAALSEVLQTVPSSVLREFLHLREVHEFAYGAYFSVDLEQVPSGGAIGIPKGRGVKSSNRSRPANRPAAFTIISAEFSPEPIESAIPADVDGSLALLSASALWEYPSRPGCIHSCLIPDLARASFQTNRTPALGALEQLVFRLKT